MNKENLTYNIEEKDGTKLQIDLEVDWQEVEEHREAVLSRLSQEVSIEGFRPGKAPQEMIEKKVGEDQILSEMAEKVVTDSYRQVVQQEDLDLVGRPQVTITKLAKDNPLEFSVLVNKMPEVKLPDYKKIAKEAKQEEKSIEVEDQEVKEAINHIKTQWAKHEKMKDLDKSEKEETSPEEIEVKDEDLPELTDDLVKKLGDFTDVEDFREKIENNLRQEKLRREKDRIRGLIIDKILEKTEIELPDVMVESELDSMINQFKADVERAGANFAEYLDHIDKTEADLRKEWRADAKKRASTQLLLNKIAQAEGIEISDEESAPYVKQILENHPDSNEVGARIYVHTTLLNQKVMELLEGSQPETDK